MDLLYHKLHRYELIFYPGLLRDAAKRYCFTAHADDHMFPLFLVVRTIPSPNRCVATIGAGVLLRL